MQDNRELMELDEQAGRMFTGDDDATICASLLVMLTGAFVCIVCLDLLTDIVAILAPFAGILKHKCL
jgi:hypothetical protein